MRATTQAPPRAGIGLETLDGPDAPVVHADRGVDRRVAALHEVARRARRRAQCCRAVREPGTGRSGRRERLRRCGRGCSGRRRDRRPPASRSAGPASSAAGWPHDVLDGAVGPANDVRQRSGRHAAVGTGAPDRRTRRVPYNSVAPRARSLSRKSSSIVRTQSSTHASRPPSIGSAQSDSRLDSSPSARCCRN